MSDARKVGHVIASISFNSLKLQACKEDGTAEVWFIIYTLIIKSN